MELTKVWKYFFVVGIAFCFLTAFIVNPIHAEDATPTPSESPVISETSTATETPPEITPTPTPQDSVVPQPTDSELTPIASAVPEELQPSADLSSEATVPPGPVWIKSSVGIVSFNTINQALNSIYFGLIPTDGIIHIEATYGTDPGIVEESPRIEIYYDSAKLPNSACIKGLIGPTPGPGVTLPTISVPVSILGWTGGFTVSNLNFVGGIGDYEKINLEGMLKIANSSGTINLVNINIQNTDPSGVGLIVETNAGSVNLTNIDSSGNEGGGAYITTNVSGSISINTGNFDDNKSIVIANGTEINGLVLKTNQSDGAVSLTGISASRNESETIPGLYIVKSGPITIKNSVFNNNHAGGITNLAPVQQSVTLQNITANANNLCIADGCGVGLSLVVNGGVTATNITANQNKSAGMRLDTCKYESSVCQLVNTGKISIINGEFSSTVNGTGLDVISQGSVTLTKVSSRNNPGGVGVSINNAYGTGGVAIGGFAEGDNTYTGNGETLPEINRAALEIYSKGSVQLNYVLSGSSANKNSLIGAYINNAEGTSPIQISSSTFQNNDGPGLVIRSKKNITLTNVKASENRGDMGLDVDNDSGGHGSGTVAINGLSAQHNGRIGLNIRSAGAISLASANASDNPEGGAVIECTASFDKPITISKSYFDRNATGNGLSITSIGMITLTGVGASWNAGGRGFELLDARLNLGGVVVDNSINPYLYHFYKNYGDGVHITTQGGVSLKSVNADQSVNAGGAWVDNSSGVKPVSFSNGHFNENKNGDGLYVKSRGAITLEKISAARNSLNGATLHNDLAATGVLPIKINNDSTKIGTFWNGFYNNGADGLEIGAFGPVTMSNVEANENTVNGAVINNFAGSSTDVKISNSYFNHNSGGFGVTIESLGNINLSGGSASGNGLQGASLDSQRGMSFPIKTISISNFLFNDNTSGHGLEAKANGVISLTGSQNLQNGSFGARLNNKFDNGVTPLSGMGVIVKSSILSDNLSGNGLEVITTGTVLIDTVAASGNVNGGGINILSEPSTSTIKAVTLNRVTVNGNDQNGLDVTANGAISGNGINANGNDHFGAILQNSLNPITSGVTLISSSGLNNFNENHNGDGLRILSRGQVSIKSVTANYNVGGNGVKIDNCVAVGCSPASIFVSLVTTRTNSVDGISINTNGSKVSTVSLISSYNLSGSGITLISLSPLAAISITNGLYMGNGNYGIDLDRGGSLTPVLTGTFSFGNNNSNIYLH